MRLTGVPEFAIRPVRAASAGESETVAPRAAGSPGGPNRAEGVVTSRGASESPPLVDSDRVAEIRRALAEDRYPIIPAQIADAMIAAKLYGMIAK